MSFFKDQGEVIAEIESVTGVKVNSVQRDNPALIGGKTVTVTANNEGYSVDFGAEATKAKPAKAAEKVT